MITLLQCVEPNSPLYLNLVQIGQILFGELSKACVGEIACLWD